MMRRLQFFTFLLSIVCPAFSQSNDNDLDAMFDDGNISTAKNIIKINPTALPAGDIPIHFERILLEGLSLEVGVGYIMNMHTYELQIPSDERPGSKGTGYSLWVNPRLFLTGDAPEGYYMGMIYRRRSFSFGYTYNDFILNNGIQVASGKGRIMFEFMYGFGLRFVDNGLYETGYEPHISKLRLIMPASIKAGYKF